MRAGSVQVISGTRSRTGVPGSFSPGPSGPTPPPRTRPPGVVPVKSGSHTPPLVAGSLVVRYRNQPSTGTHLRAVQYAVEVIYLVCHEPGQSVMAFLRPSPPLRVARFRAFGACLLSLSWARYRSGPVRVEEIGYPDVRPVRLKPSREEAQARICPR
jgi:hypothetical protein